MDQLVNIIKNKKIPNAVIFEGGGAIRDAHFLAEAAVCNSAVNVPCGECVHCVKTRKNIHPDIIICSGSGKNGDVLIKDIRTIRMNAYTRPNEAERKVYIIENAGTMTEEAANAFLKILEEPPAYILFILVCINKNELPPTVLSRSMIFGSKNTENRSADESIKEKAYSIVLSITKTNEYDLLELMNIEKADFLSVSRETQNILRECYLAKSGAISANERISTLTQKLTLKSILSLIDAVDEAENALARNANTTLNKLRLCANLKKSVDL